MTLFFSVTSFKSQSPMQFPQNLPIKTTQIFNLHSHLKKNKSHHHHQQENISDPSIMSNYSFIPIFFIIISFSSLYNTSIASSSSSSNNTISDTSTSTKTYKSFIKQYCNSTSNPKICIKSLSPYASIIKTDPLTLTKISIFVAFKATNKASSVLEKLSKRKDLSHGESQVIKDCLENMNYACGEVSDSAKAIKYLNGTSSPKDKFQWANIRTWMSAAITDDSTCTDGFDDATVRNSLQKKIKNVVTNANGLISEALSLVNKFSYY